MKKKPKKPMKIKTAKAKKAKFTCGRCQKSFGNGKALQNHAKSHIQAVQEIKMLQEGVVPEETKFGSGFKGKNKIIVT